MFLNLDYKENWIWNELLDLGALVYEILEHWTGTINYIVEH